MDFLSNIPNPPLPMKPVELSPDGTPPLPLLNQQQAIPPRPSFHFDSDPFFNPPSPQAAPESEPSDSLPPADEELISDDIPFEIDSPVVPEPEFTPLPTAEERLLESIVHEHAEKPEAPVPLIHEEDLALLQSELDRVAKEARKAGGARDKALEDLHSLKTRFAALESELAAAHEVNSQAHQSRSQTEIRFAEAEKQWTDKLSHLRRMLDEVEDARDEASQQGVSKLLFMGTLAASLIAVIFAYVIGASQTPSPQVASEIASKPPVITSTLASRPVAPTEPAVALPPPSAPLHMPGLHAAKTTAWPSLPGNRWTTTSSDKELKLVFHYGTFARGIELTSTAQQDLKAIAASLKGTPFRIEVEGHTDATKVNKAKAYGNDNQSIGLARAKTVASYLISSCGLPSSMVSTSSAGDTNPPYPGSAAANQQKNRTVILKIAAQ